MYRPAAAWASPSATLGVLALAACGGAGTPAPEDARAAEVRATEARVTELEEEQRRREARIRELEGRLALSRAEARELRAAMERRETAPPRETVRIGHAAEAAPGEVGPPETPAPSEEAPEGDGAPRPVLRLYGTRPAAAPVGGEAPALEVPAPPPGVSLQLPVRTMPWDPRTRPRPAAVSPAPAPAPASMAPRATESPGAERASYERALAFLTARRFDEAADAFTGHLERWANGRHATAALYWRGEAHYAARRYDLALRDFRRVVSRSPRGRRAPDALYKVALCQRRRGDLAASRETLARLVRDFPDSVAARQVAQEDAS